MHFATVSIICIYGSKVLSDFQDSSSDPILSITSYGPLLQSLLAHQNNHVTIPHKHHVYIFTYGKIFHCFLHSHLECSDSNHLNSSYSSRLCPIFPLYLLQWLHGCSSIKKQLVVSYPNGLFKVACFHERMWALKSGRTGFGVIANAY